MRNRFAGRNGYMQVRTAVQHQSMDQPLRTALWNMVYPLCFDNPWDFNARLREIWKEFDKPLDRYSPSAVRELFRETIHRGEWYEVCSLLEAIYDYNFEAPYEDDLTDVLNTILDRHLAGYRMLDGLIVEIVEEHELDEIEDALDASNAGAHRHLEKAIAMLADRENPDYVNVVKESISAVEAMATELVPGKKLLPDALKKLKFDTGASIHGALLDGWMKIYGYTSDESGIRHGNSSEHVSITPAFARYFLITCSAFVNLLAAERKPEGS